jgi:hypothetical protein
VEVDWEDKKGILDTAGEKKERRWHGGDQGCGIWNGMGWDSSVGIVTSYELDGPGI